MSEKKKTGSAVKTIIYGLLAAMVLAMIFAGESKTTHQTTSQAEPATASATYGNARTHVNKNVVSLMEKPLVILGKNVGTLAAMANNCLKIPAPDIHPSAEFFVDRLTGSTVDFAYEELGRPAMYIRFNCAGDVCTPEGLDDVASKTELDLTNLNQNQLDVMVMGILSVCGISKETVQNAPAI